MINKGNGSVENNDLREHGSNMIAEEELFVSVRNNFKSLCGLRIN